MSSPETDFVGSLIHSCVHCQDLLLDQGLEPLKSPKPDSPAHSWSGVALSLDNGTGKPSLLTKRISFKAACGASRDGCKFMQYVTSARIPQIRPPGYIEPKDDWYLKLRLHIGEHGGDYYNRVTSSFVAPKKLWRWHRFKQERGSRYLKVYAAKDNPASRSIKTRPFNTSPGSDETFKLARGWMAECQNSHTACPRFQPTQMPSRVLDVGTEQLPETLKVVETLGLQVAPYMALSYCWGPVPGLTALTRNIQRLKQQVEYEDLPRTLQDAVRTCRKLRIRYLWVDALCIIQDDPIDCAQVISSMPQIYRHAFVTVLASRAWGSHIGFLGERDLSDLILRPDEIFKIGYICPNGELGSIILYNSVESMIQEPIEKRGWTLQEKLLSPRILRYGPQALSWVCKSSYPRTQYMDGGIVNSGFTINGIPKTFEEWYDLVHEYGGRAVAVPEDRLVAVAAIAEETGKILRDRYLAGIWWGSMPQGLLWRGPSGHSGIPKKKRQLCVAPTWSWASADCVSCLTHRDTEDDFQVEILKCETQLKFSNIPFGAVESGQLVIKGRLKPQKYFPDKEHKVPIGGGAMGISAVVEDSLVPEVESAWINISWDITEIELDSLREQENGTDFIRVQYLEFYTKQMWYDSKFTCNGLFLLPSGDCFQRVGLATFDWYLNSGDAAQRRGAIIKWRDKVKPQEITII